MQVGDIGTLINITVVDSNGDARDISASTTKQIILERPDQSLLTVNAFFVTNGSDGQLGYLTANGDINQVGNWKVQAYYVTASGAWKTVPTKFKVLANLPT